MVRRLLSSQGMRRLAGAIWISLVTIAATAPGSHAQAVRPGTKNAAAKPARFQVAAGTALLLSVRTPLDSATALVGDQVEAVLWSPVIQHDMELIPEGSVMLGKVRRVVRASERTPAGSLTLAFTIVEHAETRSRATLTTHDVVVTATLEPPRGRIKRRPTPVDASIAAGSRLVATTSAPLMVWIPR
jgi:hypothetical protein